MVDHECVNIFRGFAGDEANTELARHLGQTIVMPTALNRPSIPWKKVKEASDGIVRDEEDSEDGEPE